VNAETHLRFFDQYWKSFPVCTTCFCDPKDMVRYLHEGSGERSIVDAREFGYLLAKNFIYTDQRLASRDI
jgi:hypothetical protein